MSNVIAPLPGGLGVTMVAEHHSGRNSDTHHPPDEEPSDEHATDEHRSPDSRHRQTATPAPAPVLDDPVVPAETLFEATLLANRLLPNGPSPKEYLLRRPQEWTPPESSLRLKDTLA